MTSKINTLIIGQGLAGTLLSWELHKRNIDFLVIDDSHRDSSSMMSAGLVQPVTGPRLVLTPGFEKYYTAALATYRELEDTLKESFFFETPFVRIFTKPSELVYWNQKHRLETNLPHVKESYPAGHWPGITDTMGSVEFLQSGYCDTRKLLEAYKKFLIHDHLLVQEPVNYTDILIKENHAEWKNVKAQRIIFCEGWQAQNNPWFKHLPYNNAKGEILTLDIPDHPRPGAIFSGGQWICPAGKHFRAGSAFCWDDLNTIPTEQGKQDILSGLSAFLNKPVSVIDHRAGVRPIFKDLKPRAEFHPDHPRLGIFNGLGSKGVLIGPSYAKNFAAWWSH